MYELGSIITLKKPHACQTNRWEIIRMGMDIKLRCLHCQQIIMMPRAKFEQQLKSVISSPKHTETK